MADSRRYIPIQPLNLEQILHEAQHRWLRPTEICEILRNHEKFHLTPEPPVRPPAGSLFLFDRKVLRYFRKDGHRWRKKKDGKTVKEAHEKLKAGSVDVLHCYYAHGEDNENFQRRSYWMLDEELENIVLVHYREVKEGSKLGGSRLLNATAGSRLGSPQNSSAPCLEHTNYTLSAAQTSYPSTPNVVDWNDQTFSSEFDDRNSGEGPGTSSVAQPVHGSVLVNEAAGFPELAGSHLDSGFGGSVINPGTSPSIWADVHCSRENSTCKHEPDLYFEKLNAADHLTHKLTGARLVADNTVQDVSRGDRLIPGGQRTAQVQNFQLLQTHYQNNSGSQSVDTSIAKVDASVGGASNEEAGELKKLDSFGRWMDKEIGVDCDNSLMASDSGNYWNTLETENDDKEVSSLSRHMQLDIDSMGPSLSKEQLFSICDFAPDWAYSGIETKVLITGTFLGDMKDSGSLRWCCMFGEVEVSAEVLGNNVIRCQVPFHVPGRIPFYITSGNRLACSEVREFEYREKPSEVSTTANHKNLPEEEVRLQIRLAKILHVGLDKKWLDCSIVECDKCRLSNDFNSLKLGIKSDWERIEHAVREGYNVRPGDALIQNLLKDKLYEWLVSSVHEVRGPHLLDNEGCGVIHLAAALGYEWAMGPIVAAGVGPNFRDARGRTALHWASYYGREETVIALVKLGAAAGAVDDPTPAFPGGQTAADLASSRGHKGIAGYLAEADLTSHLFALTLDESAISNAAATFAEEKAMEIATQNVISPASGINEEQCMRGSLAAVRKSAHAAALIQAAFRARSFRDRQRTKTSDDTTEASVDLVALGSLNRVQKVSHFEDYLHSAAIRIQQKYRGWKGRKEFLKIRNRIVKIQAHVRGHQVRKQYKKVVWSVGIVEKAILRWRRKGHGLRGFRRDNTIDNVVPGTEKNDEYEFLRIGRKQKFAGVEKALARVQSMVRHPEARDQYMRLVNKFENFKLNDEAACKSGEVGNTSVS